MIILTIQDNSLTPDSLSLLNAAVHSILPPAINIPANSNITWQLDYPDIFGSLYTPQGNIMVSTKTSPLENYSLQLLSLTIDGQPLPKQFSLSITPLSETQVYQKLDELYPPLTQKPEPHSQLSACSQLIQEIYSNNPDYQTNPDFIPKTFLTKLDLDDYLANLAITLEESILLWMESSGRLSVNLDDQDINMPLLLKKTFKRAFMFGPARNKVMVELIDGTTKPFSYLTPSFQLEICSEILSILPSIS